MPEKRDPRAVADTARVLDVTEDEVLAHKPSSIEQRAAFHHALLDLRGVLAAELDRIGRRLLRRPPA